MIEFRKCAVVDGQAYPTIEAARAAILDHLLKNEPMTPGTTVSQWIVKHGDFVLDVLTTREGSKPSARKINGGTKKRKASVVPTASQEAKP